jgi:hypothetical protein
LKQLIQQTFPDIQVLNDLKDLGTHLCFDKRFHCTTIDQRLASAFDRLDIMEKSKHTFEVRAKLIKQSILPLVFFNPLMHFVSNKKNVFSNN